MSQNHTKESGTASSSKSITPKGAAARPSIPDIPGQMDLFDPRYDYNPPAVHGRSARGLKPKGTSRKGGVIC